MSGYDSGGGFLLRLLIGIYRLLANSGGWFISWIVSGCLKDRLASRMS